jgi:hypothetical protein
VSEQKTGSAEAAGVGSNFPFLQGFYLSTQGVSQELRPEAYAQHGYFPLQGFFYTAHFQVQMGVFVTLVRHLRAAQDDQRVVAADIRLCFGMAMKVDVTDAVSAVPKHGIQGAEWLSRHVLKDQYFCHA